MEKNKKTSKQKKNYQDLQERYMEMNAYLLELIDEHRCTEEDLRYFHDFVHYKKLDEEFHYFREHAHEDENSELPFPYLVL